MTQFVTPEEVRAYAKAEEEGRWLDAVLVGQIEAAGELLEYRTGRQFAVEAGVAKTFPTEGAPTIVLPDFRSVTSVTLDGVAVVENTDFRLLPDPVRSGIYVGIRLRPPIGATGWATWWTDITTAPVSTLPGRYYPNAVLGVTGNWGHVPYPAELKLATKAAAAFLTLRPDALLAGARATPDGNVFDLSRWPIEVSDFITAWRRPDRQPARAGVFE